ncbi:MAG: 3-oxoadipate enol-lactonase [Bradyrhizobiaceae bacterium]|nr:MAG: 3-oxoadipate enol-lactonase [Bradyrhizobiaceae bacterium]
MPTIEADDGCRLNVEVEGRDRGPTIMLSNSLGTTMAMWEPQMAALTGLFRVIRYDRRGHGKSDVTPAPYSIERLGHDALAILDGLKIERVHWCGLSIGGMVGQWLAANAPERFDRVVLANSSSYFPDQTNWDKRIEVIRQSGLAPIANSVIASWFTRGFREREPDTIKRVREMLISTPVEGYIGASEAIAGMDNREFLPRIKSPTLVIAGRHDPSTPLAMNEFIRSQIPGASLTLLESSHMSNIEQAHDFTEAVTDFLTQH